MHSLLVLYATTMLKNCSVRYIYIHALDLLDACSSFVLYATSML